MGYNAYGSGYIELTRKPFEAEQKQIEGILGDFFEYSRAFVDNDRFHPYTYDLYFDGRYHGDEIIDALQRVNAVCNVKEGEVDYTGEDDERWRHIFRDGKWKEENGFTLYEGDTDFIRSSLETPLGTIRFEIENEDGESPFLSASIVMEDGRRGVISRIGYDDIIKKIVSRSYTLDHQSLPIHTTTLVAKEW